MKKRALITGIGGQDGSYLAEFLIEKGYEVFGLARPDKDLGFVPKGVSIISGDLTDESSIQNAVQKSIPDEIYNLAGVTDLKTAYEQPEMTLKVNDKNIHILLDEALIVNSSVRFLQASSSEIFLPSEAPLDENSARDWQTTNPYAKAKLMADRDIVQASRADKGVFACSAILFNHESPRRSEKSVIRKITKTFAKIKLGQAPLLEIGNIELSRDWGFAGDYVRAMWSMLQQDKPEDFVIATGKIHSVKDVINVAAQTVGIELSWQGEGMEMLATDSAGKKIVQVNPEFYRPAEQYPKIGNIQKAEKTLGWKPEVDFQGLIEMMVRSEL